ncbi:hypothetical protein J437_LFUL005838 [Ladona fulva]|uniref:Uncharacterized protein n=1 Tax=Ladona fulva TaxID=123851 RepID=A0A8K0P4G1_LADFU|nr:hypothetical protein J437_LFUL005838 [Ladona fulva]
MNIWSVLLSEEKELGIKEFRSAIQKNPPQHTDNFSSYTKKCKIIPSSKPWVSEEMRAYSDYLKDLYFQYKSKNEEDIEIKYKYNTKSQKLFLSSTKSTYNNHRLLSCPNKFRKGSPDDFNSYRPIALLTQFSKIFEKSFWGCLVSVMSSGKGPRSKTRVRVHCTIFSRRLPPLDAATSSFNALIGSWAPPFINSALLFLRLLVTSSTGTKFQYKAGMGAKGHCIVYH